MKASIPGILSFNGGYVDTMGYLALQGLFTAHVTGNFVTIGAALVFGRAGVFAKLLALPVFCLVIIVARRASVKLVVRRVPPLPMMLSAQCLLLLLGGAGAVLHGAFTQADSWPAVATGMLFVSAMAVQNAAHRLHLASAPPSTLMTGTTTQLMIDVSDALQGLAPETRAATLARMRGMSLAVGCFAIGAAAAALLFAQFPNVCFGVPPIVAFIARSIATNAGRSSMSSTS